MLISRFNGVAWFHDVDTIAHRREKQVVFPVWVTNDGPRDIAWRHSGRARCLSDEAYGLTFVSYLDLRS